MLRISRISFLRVRSTLGPCSLHQRRCIGTKEVAPQKEGDISSVFRSLSGGDESEQLPQRFADVKRRLVQDKDALHASWNRLLIRLRDETEHVKSQGSSCIPEIDFNEIKSPSKEFKEALRNRGVAVVRQVVPEKEAREYKEEAQRYVAANPSTKGECLLTKLCRLKIESN